MNRAEDPDVVYNSQDNEYLVVWDGEDDQNGLVLNEFEILGQRLSADGGEVGDNDFRAASERSGLR